MIRQRSSPDPLVVDEIDDPTPTFVENRPVAGGTALAHMKVSSVSPVAGPVWESQPPVAPRRGLLGSGPGPAAPLETVWNRGDGKT